MLAVGEVNALVVGGGGEEFVLVFEELAPGDEGLGFGAARGQFVFEQGLVNVDGFVAALVIGEELGFFEGDGDGEVGGDGFFLELGEVIEGEFPLTGVGGHEAEAGVGALEFEGARVPLDEVAVELFGAHFAASGAGGVGAVGGDAGVHAFDVEVLRGHEEIGLGEPGFVRGLHVAFHPAEAADEDGAFVLLGLGADALDFAQEFDAGVGTAVEAGEGEEDVLDAVVLGFVAVLVEGVPVELAGVVDLVLLGAGDAGPIDGFGEAHAAGVLGDEAVEVSAEGGPVAAELVDFPGFEKGLFEPVALGGIDFAIGGEGGVDLAEGAEGVAFEDAGFTGVGRFGELAQVGVEFFDGAFVVGEHEAGVGAAEDGGGLVATGFGVGFEVVGEVVAAELVVAIEAVGHAVPVVGVFGDGEFGVTADDLAEEADGGLMLVGHELGEAGHEEGFGGEFVFGVLLGELFEDAGGVEEVLGVVVRLGHEETDASGVAGIGFAFKAEEPGVGAGDAAVVALELEPALDDGESGLGLLLGVAGEGEGVFEDEGGFAPAFEAEVGEAEAHADAEVEVGAGGEGAVLAFDAGEDVLFGKDEGFTAGAGGEGSELAFEALDAIGLVLDEALGGPDALEAEDGGVEVARVEETAAEVGGEAVEGDDLGDLVHEGLEGADEGFGGGELVELEEGVEAEGLGAEGGFVAEVPKARGLLLEEGGGFDVVVFQDVGGAVEENALHAARLLELGGLVVGEEGGAGFLVGHDLEEDDAFPEGELVLEFGVELGLGEGFGDESAGGAVLAEADAAEGEQGFDFGDGVRHGGVGAVVLEEGVVLGGGFLPVLGLVGGVAGLDELKRGADFPGGGGLRGEVGDREKHQQGERSDAPSLGKVCG